MLRQRQVLLLIGVVTLGIAVAELITSDPLTRLIPADVLRGIQHLGPDHVQVNCSQN